MRFYISEKLLLEKLELVAYAPNCFDLPLFGDVCKLFAESLDMYVNSSRVAEVVKAPNLVKKLVAGEHSVVVGCEEIEKFKFFGRNVNRLSAELEFIFLKRDLEVVKFYNFGIVAFVTCATAENCLYARHNFFCIKGLCDKIVCSELEAQNFVKNFVLCSEHDDGLRGDLADFAADLPTVLAGHHDVEKNKIGFVDFECIHTVNTVISGFDHITLILKIEFKHITDIRVIIYY